MVTDNFSSVERFGRLYLLWGGYRLRQLDGKQERLPVLPCTTTRKPDQLVAVVAVVAVADRFVVHWLPLSTATGTGETTPDRPVLRNLSPPPVDLRSRLPSIV